mmetsp:Transcript_26041/g.63580  ORF Transcript_26041/g.63580 Transcript_26041/m.63580 type:complete len:143 (-) Transcript_26041:192-620(-)|eukprot:CAMPEP_0113635354 /NCGR_PEP_ID=MMETSP0017_2-20120614/18432_1 /TAXON_ID=2856 /ORGANISM="Cylindrotheca closterium" /LENGTH=142 /DNA_ID=CAMNT_0000546137 /DNA_START=99 /DNA_END=527 /DNA_ORIENTATION=+ /assembly_acc=CAM_ASM_000147
MPGYMYSACGVCYTALDPKNIMILLKEHNECLCCTHDCCLVPGDDGYGVGFEKSMVNIAAAKAGRSTGNICDLKMYLCQCGLKYPEVLCKGSSNCLCCKQAQSFPFDDDHVKGPVCAICFVQILPEFKVLAEAPELPSIVRD